MGESVEIVFFLPTVCTRCTPFKGVTDLLLKWLCQCCVHVEDKFSCIVSVFSAVTVIEGVGPVPKAKCKHSLLNLPKKLGELVSSMYLLGALKALTECRKIGSFRSYGLFVMLKQYTTKLQIRKTLKFTSFGKVLTLVDYRIR